MRRAHTAPHERTERRAIAVFRGSSKLHGRAPPRRQRERRIEVRAINKQAHTFGRGTLLSENSMFGGLSDVMAGSEFKAQKGLNDGPICLKNGLIHRASGCRLVLRSVFKAP